jgi:Ca2+-binding RTX toxin-like protein
VLIGGLGTDTLYGEGNHDTFYFSATSETAVGAARDVIHGLDDGSDDIIDLSAMSGADTFIGTTAFSAPGQVRIQQAGANVLVQINATGVNGAEAEILIVGATIGAGAGQVNGGDFVF